MDKKIFKKTFKFVCDECGEFAHTETEYCEKCGVKALRKATNEDYTRYEMEINRDDKVHQIRFEKAKETKMVAEKAERKAEKAEKKVEKAAEKAKRKAEKTKNAAEKAKKKVKKAAEKAKKKTEKT